MGGLHGFEARTPQEQPPSRQSRALPSSRPHRRNGSPGRTPCRKIHYQDDDGRAAGRSRQPAVDKLEPGRSGESWSDAVACTGEGDVVAGRDGPGTGNAKHPRLDDTAIRFRPLPAIGPASRAPRGGPDDAVTTGGRSRVVKKKQILGVIPSPRVVAPISSNDLAFRDRIRCNPRRMEQRRTNEITFRAVVTGLLLSVIMGAATVYFGLKAGMTVSASIPAAVIAMGTFRLFPRRGTILESNLVQTAASAGESLAAGIIFTMPALVLSGYWESFYGWEPFIVITTVALAGGLLGVLFMIPMRQVFVVDNKDLAYPEGVACARVLEAGESAGRDSLLVLTGIGIGAILKVLISFFRVLASTVESAVAVGGRVLYIGCDVSPGLIAVGTIVGLPIAVQIFLGGAIGWWLGVPALGGHDATATSATEYAWMLWSSEVRYMGVGAMVIGGLVTIFKVRAGLLGAVHELRRQFGPGSSSTTNPGADDTGRNLGGGVILTLGLLSTAVIAGLYYYLTRGVAIASVTTVIMVVLAFFITAVASYIVGLVGNSNSPVSGMTITAVLATALLMWLLGFDGSQAILATLGVAGVVCCTACTAGDVCNDLKTGHLVGASPRRQQILQILGVVVASLVMWPVLLLLHESHAASGGIGGRELSAPQASLFASLAQGFFGDRELPWDMLAIGGLVGLGILALDAVLGVILGANRQFRLHIMPVAVGIYLPFGLAVPILLGGIVSVLIRRGTGARREAVLGASILLASGMIAGEALTGVLLAVPRLLGFTPEIQLPASVTSGLGVVSVVAVCGILLAIPRRRA